MRLRTILRSSGALRVAPIALALAIYYFYSMHLTSRIYEWAPTVVGRAEITTVPFAYAAAAGLGAWESGRLSAGAIWQLAPSRSRYRIAAEVLAPIIALAWLMHIVVIGLSFLRNGVTPTLGSLRVLIIVLPLCVCYAAIGFAAGLRLHRGIAAPIVGALAWIVTAMDGSIGLPWPRQMLGNFPRIPSFGELVSWHSIVPHLLAVGGITVGLALLWWTGPQKLRVALAVAVIVVTPSAAYAMVHDWGYAPPMNAGQAATRCIGISPRVCMPEVTSQSISQVREQVISMINDLDALGVGTRRPSVVTDTLLKSHGRASSDASVLYVPLTTSTNYHSLRLAVLESSIRFTCAHPAFAPAEAARMWVADGTGEKTSFKAALTRQFAFSANPTLVVGEITQVVDRVRTTSQKNQQEWFHRNMQAACEKPA